MTATGCPEATVTTVLVPAERGPEKVCPVVSYQCAIDAVNSRCFPSYALRKGALAVGALAQLEFLLISAALAEGWAVSVPDHEGSAGIWGTPYEPGYRILDGLRAALGYHRLPLSPAAPIGLWGYSGGGLASAWAVEVSADYAPELHVVGAVLGSPVGDLGSTFRRLNGTFFSALPAMVVAALSHVYPELDRVIKRHATEEGRALLESLEKMTTVAAVLKMANKDMDSYVDRPLDEILEEPEVQFVFEDIKLGTAGARSAGAHRAGRARQDRLRRRHRPAHRELSVGRGVRDVPPGHVQRAHAAAPDVGADGAALAARPVRWAAAVRASGAHPVAHAVQPFDLQGHDQTPDDRRAGHHGPEVAPPAAVLLRRIA